MIKYFSYRHVSLDGSSTVINPKRMLDDCFKDLSFTYRLAVASGNTSGKSLGCIEADTADIATEVIDGLCMFGAKELTLNEAQTLAQENSDFTVTINQELGKLEFTDPYA